MIGRGEKVTSSVLSLPHPFLSPSLHYFSFCFVVFGVVLPVSTFNILLAIDFTANRGDVPRVPFTSSFACFGSALSAC